MQPIVNTFRPCHALAALLALGAAAGVRAATVPTGFQEYIVLGHEQHVYDMNNRPVLGQPPTAYALSGGMRSTVTITASSDNQIIYYDQWEDGYEADLLAPPHDASTFVFGNGDSTDGRACEFILNRACTGVAAVDDTIRRGETLTLASVTIPGTPSAPNCTGGGNALGNCVPIPRNAADQRFDGGDRVISSGGPVTMVHVQEPTANVGGVLGGAVEVLPLQAVRNATTYSVPVGEDTFTRLGGSGTAGMPFRFVDLDLVAFENGTAVQVTSPGATGGTVNFVLDRGQHWSSRGAIDLAGAPALTINEGTKISVNKPIAGLIFASSTGFYATRSFALLPDLLHANDYVMTAPGDNTAVRGTSVHDLYVYNPSPSASISVTATDSVGTTTFNVPANSSVAYSTPAGANRALPNGSTVRLFSNGKFWGITAYDSRNVNFDWGHSWLATDFLSDTYTIPFAPDNPNRTISPPAGAAAPGSGGSGAMPAFVAATANNTCVRVDFDNDGTFDPIRRADGTLVAFAGAGACADGYLINALQSLRIFDNNAADGTLNNDVSGARVAASKPVALSYGVDSDASPTSGAGLLDLGYAIYPVDQRFLDPVLLVDKTTNVSSVPANLPAGQGTLVTYRLQARAFNFGPLTALAITDLLPPQVSGPACVAAAGPGSGYVCNSTTITYPDLSTESGADAEPQFALVAGRDRLTWNASVFGGNPMLPQQTDTLNKNETIIIEYRVRVEGGPSTVLRNDAEARASLGGSAFFTPTVSATVVRTNVSLAKSVTDDGTPEANELVTYALTVTNNSASATETGVTITDPIPANLTYHPGSANSPAPFTGTFSAAQNAVVWTAPSLAPGASAVLTFQARINPAVGAGTVIANTGRYESTQTATFSSNAVTTSVVGANLSNITKSAVGNPASVNPGQVVTFEVVVRNTGSAPAGNVLLTDLVPVNASYVAGTLEWKLNAGAFSPLTDAADGLEGGPGGADGRAVDTGGSPAVDQVELRRPTLGPGEDLTLRFKVSVNAGTVGQTLNNSATVQAANFPAADSPLVQIPISAAVPASLAAGKVSSAGGSVLPGETVTYTVTVSNNSGVAQDNVAVTDTLPAGVTYVGASTLVTAPSLRVTQYPISATSATTLDVALSQPLAGNYFVIVRGSDGDGSANGDKGPDENYFSLTGDPTGKGDLTNLASNTLRFTRHNNVEGWTGVVTVVESLPGAGGDGFTLRSVERVSHPGAATSGTDTSAVAWSDIGKVMLMGGYQGAGCDSTETDRRRNVSCHARLFPSGASTINWTRGPASDLSTATSTVMVVEWGANWTVQRRRVQGNNGGNGADAAGEYNTAAITAVARANTWVWGTGHTNDRDVGESGEGVLVTLGNGVAKNASESLLAAGIEHSGKAVDFEVWALTHPQLATDFRFKPDGDAGAATVDVAVNAAGASRLALAYNGLDGTTDNYPRPIFSARHTSATNVRLERRRTGSDFPAWVQSVDFTGLTETVAGGAPPALAGGLALPDGTALVVTFQVTVNDPLAPGTALTNTATATSTQVPGGVSAMVTDTVVRLDVGIEPNSAGSVIASSLAQTFSFTHTVTNRGGSTDSYRLAATSMNGWKLELVDPATGVVIATDSNGDGVWDGGALPNTGSLAPGASRSYRLRVTVPAATAAGVVDALRLRATSDTRPSVTASAQDTLAVVDGGVAGAADVLVTPDNASSVPMPPSPGPVAQVAYTHTVTNRTGATRAFQLQSHSSQGFTTRVFRDSNGDGVYTPGVDTQITQTASLADGASQRIFVVVDVPAGTPAGTVDSTSVTASTFPTDNPNFNGSATDTTTVVPATDQGDNAVGFSIAGGGSQVVAPGGTASYPGTLSNLGSAADRYEFSLSASIYADGLATPQPDDGLPHATRLVLVDTNGNGVLDALDNAVAVDNDGDGVWDLIDADGDGTFDPPGTTGIYNLDGDATPDLALAGGASAPYLLARPVHVDQGPFNDSVTFTATSVGSGKSDAVTVTTSVQAATLAVIGELIAFATPAGVVVQWSTESEHGTVGFTLERERGPGRWQPVNASLLPAMLHSRHGAVYRLLDAGVQAGELVAYRLLELEATGSVLEHGPYTVAVADQAPPEPAGEADRPLPGFQRVARAMDALSQARQQRKVQARQAALLRRLERRGATVKVGVRESGLYRIAAADIATVMDRPLARVRRDIAGNRLELTRAGERVATLAAEGGYALLFYGQAIDSPYTRDNVYLLRPGRGLRMAQVSARAPRPAPGQVDTFTAHAEGNRYYLTHLFDDPDDDYWMWDFRFEDMLFADNHAYFPVATPSVAGTGTATVTVRLHGALEALHRARVTLQGTVDVVRETQWRGLTPHELTFQVDAALLRDGENRIQVAGLGSGDPARPSTFYINDVDITYLRRRVAVDDALHADHAPGGVTTIDGFAGDDVMVFDVSVPARPRPMRHVGVDATAAGTRVSVAPAGSNVTRVLALTGAALRAPQFLTVDTPSLLRSTGHRVDWLLITSADMLEAARTLADHRRGQGLRTLVVDLEDVYDEFAHGVRDADAIWSLLRFAHDHWQAAPRYVVLAGEGSFDYKDHLGHGDSIIPTLLAPTRDGLFPSDNLFADVAGNDFVPEMAIGRLPVIDAAELEAVSRKIIAYEASSGAWTGAAVFGADTADAGGDFAAASEGIRQAIPPGLVAVDTLYIDPLLLPSPLARQRLHADLNAGRAFFNFVGHAGNGSIGNVNPGLISSDDLLAPGGTLANGDNLPVVTAFTCLVGQFGSPGDDGVGELLLLSPDRGAAAVFAPSGLSHTYLARRLGEGFYRATYDDGELVIGEAILKAQRAYAGTGGEAYLLDIYNLLGDPATIMK